MLIKTGRQLFVLLTTIVVLTFVADVRPQVVVDRTVATVSDGVRTELITYSNLLWQMALQRGVQLEPPRQEDLRRALQLQIEQRIFALEAQRVPRAEPTEQEISNEIADVLKTLSIGAAEFERRLRAVGFDSVRDDNFEELIAQRIAIEKYVDFRFRAFVVITAEEEEKFYNETWVPQFKQLNPNADVPALERERADVIAKATEARVAREMEAFVEQARQRVTVTILHEP